MDSILMQHLQRLYGLDPFIPHMAFQFPRLPPSQSRPMTFDHIREQFLKQLDTIGGLDRFTYASKQQSEDLLSGTNTNHPNHPLYTEQDSIRTLRAKNDKLAKENTELRKKIDEISSNH